MSLHSSQLNSVAFLVNEKDWDDAFCLHGLFSPSLAKDDLQFHVGAIGILAVIRTHCTNLVCNSLGETAINWSFIEIG